MSDTPQALRAVEVHGAQPYRIAIGPGLLDDGEALAAHVRGRHVLVVSDGKVAPLYARALADTLQARLPRARVIVSCIPAGEASKSLEGFAEREHAGVAGGAVLHDFGHAGAQLAVGQGPQGRGVGEHRARRMEGADQVLALRQVHRGLAANRRVDHRQQRRGWRRSRQARA